MRFRVAKNLSEAKLHTLILDQAKMYCAEVLKTGAMSGPALAQQRILLQYYEALEEGKVDQNELPGQLGMFP